MRLRPDGRTPSVDGASDGAGWTEVVHGFAIEDSSDPDSAQLSVAVPTLGQAALERAIVATVQPDPGTPTA